MKKLLIPLALLIAITPAFGREIAPQRMNSETYQFCREANTLPDFRELDIDRDGLVNYREMRTTNAKHISLFYAMDTNHDDYISPSELDTYAQVGNCGEEQ